MPASKPKTRTVKVTEARQQFSELLNSVYKQQGRVLIEKSGIPVAALISAQDLERLDRLEADRRERFSALFEIGDAFRDVPVATLEREVDRAVAEVRATARAERARASRAKNSSPAPVRRRRVG